MFLAFSTNTISIDLNDLIEFYHKSIQSFHDRSVVTFLTIRRFLIFWAHLISYPCSFLIWSNRIVIDVVSFKDTIKKTLKIGPFVSGHQEPSYDAAVFNTKGIDWIQHKIYYLRLLIGQSNTRTSASSLLQFGICCRITDACISLSTLGIATRRFPDISHLDA